MIKRILAGGAILLTVPVSMYATGGQTADAATLDTQMASGVAGSEVLVIGDDYLPLVGVGICWDRSGCSDLGTAEPAGLLVGRFTVSVSVPGSAPPGQYRIHACQLLDLGLTCSSALFEVLAAEPTSTTTTPSDPTTSTQPPPTTSTPPVSTTTVFQTTTTIAPSTTTIPPDEPGFEDPGQSEPIIVSSDEASTTPPTDTPDETATTTTSLTSSFDREDYTPPTVTSTSPSLPDSQPDQNQPTVTLQATEEGTSPISLLDDPALFWATWLLTVLVGTGVVTSLIWIVRRLRREQ